MKMVIDMQAGHQMTDTYLQVGAVRLRHERSHTVANAIPSRKHPAATASAVTTCRYRVNSAAAAAAVAAIGVRIIVALAIVSLSIIFIVLCSHLSANVSTLLRRKLRVKHIHNQHHPLLLLVSRLIRLVVIIIIVTVAAAVAAAAAPPDLMLKAIIEE